MDCLNLPVFLKDPIFPDALANGDGTFRQQNTYPSNDGALWGTYINTYLNSLSWVLKSGSTPDPLLVVTPPIVFSNTSVVYKNNWDNTVLYDALKVGVIEMFNMNNLLLINSAAGYTLGTGLNLQTLINDYIILNNTKCEDHSGLCSAIKSAIDSIEINVYQVQSAINYILIKV